MYGGLGYAGTGYSGPRYVNARDVTAPIDKKWFPNGLPDIVKWFGAEPTEWYMPGQHASGSIVGLKAGTVLTPVGTPLYEQVYDPDVNGTNFTTGTTDSFDSAAGVHSIATEAFCWLVPFRMQPFYSGYYANLIGNCDGRSAQVGYCSFVTSGNMQVTLQGTATYSQISDVTAGAALNTDPHYLMFGASVIENKVISFCDIGGEQIAARAYSQIGSIATSGIFSFGSVGAYDAGTSIIPAAIFWTGADAEIVLAGRATNFPAWWTS